jgi:zinc transport system substrate-binding protein
MTAKRSVPVVFAVNYPLKYFAERIAEDLAEVELHAPPGVDTAFWKPTPETILAFQRADLILLNGAGYSKWVEYSTLPASRMLNTSAGFTQAYIRDDSAGLHAHGPGETHAHGDLAFTTWLDPTLAIQQARAIHDGLTRLLPAQGDLLSRRYESLKLELERLDARLKQATSKFRGHPMVASHPVYQYFARRYGLNLRSMHWEPDDAPSDEQWTTLQSLLEDHPAKWMIWEAPPLPEVKNRLRQLNVECLVVRPCANTPSDSDWLTIMFNNARRLQERG